MSGECNKCNEHPIDCLCQQEATALDRLKKATIKMDKDLDPVSNVYQGLKTAVIFTNALIEVIEEYGELLKSIPSNDQRSKDSLSELQSDSF